jgi:beta-glucosidase-like glycosyl hydrolase
MVVSDSALVRKLTRYLPLGREELAVLHRQEAQRRSIAAGTDLVLITGLEAASQGVYQHLLDEARQGVIPMDVLRASYERILALKAGL